MIGSRLPTTREIAAACRCSQSTVSNALRDHPRISPATREKIQRVARSLGWRANPLASAFMAHLRSTKRPRYHANLAFAVTHPANAKIDALPPHQRESFHGARQRAAELGYVLEPVWLHEPGMNAARLARILKSRGMPGLLVPSLLGPADYFSPFDWSPFASVALGHALPGVPLHRVAFNYSRGVPMALRRLHEMGYRRIGVIVSTAYDAKVDHGWLPPLYFAQKQPWARRCLKPFVFSDSTPAERLRIAEWIEETRPDVILGEYIAWHALHDLGWKIPNDIAFASFDWSVDHPDIAGIHQGHDTLGRMAVDLLTAQLLQNERGLAATPKLLLIDGSWRDAESVPARDRPPPGISRGHVSGP
jgi:LacI family transcriptional regulator